MPVDTVRIFIVMQKCELMLDVEQFGGRLDTIGRTVGTVQNMQIRRTSGTGAAKTINATDCMCSYIDGSVKISARTRIWWGETERQRGRKKDATWWLRYFATIPYEFARDSSSSSSIFQQYFLLFEYMKIPYRIKMGMDIFIERGSLCFKRKYSFFFVFGSIKIYRSEGIIRKLISFYRPAVYYVACWWTIYVIATSRNDS